MNLYKSHPGIASYRGWFCLPLILATIWGLAGTGWRNLRSFAACSTENRDGCQLDSFSSPAIAVAVLKQDAERLVTAYIQSRDREWDANVRSGSTLKSGKAGANPSLVGGPGKGSPGQAPFIQSIEQLRAQIHELQIELDRKLMLVYCRSDLWNDFVDCYLRFLRESPDNSEVILWARYALDKSQRCGRTEELAQALEQATQVHADPTMARRLRGVLEDWRAGEPSGVARQ